jgi:hypothetical protein
MRIIITSVALFLSAGAAFAQTGPVTPTPAAKPAPAAASPAVRTGKSAVVDAKAECIGMWDAGTHMSRSEWSSTCARIQTRLENLKIENLDLMGTGVRKKPGTKRQSSIDLPNRTN